MTDLARIGIKDFSRSAKILILTRINLLVRISCYRYFCGIVYYAEF